MSDDTPDDKSDKKQYFNITRKGNVITISGLECLAKSTCPPHVQFPSV